MKRKMLPYITAILIFVSCSAPAVKNDPEEWMPLFNKKDLSGWEIKVAGHPLNENFNNTFVVRDSMIVVDYSHYSEFNGAFGHLYYKEPFSYYKVRLKYRFYGKQLKGGPDYAYLNSGIMLHAQSAASNELNQGFPVSLEMQFLASDSSRKSATGNLCTPGTYIEMNGKPVYDHCINSTSPNFDPSEWVEAEAVVLGDSVIYHLVNKDTVLSYFHPKIGGGFISTGQAWANFGFSADSTRWMAKQDQRLSTGYIALQAESHPVEFKDIELLNLEGCMDPAATNYKSYFIKADNSKCIYK